MLRPIRQALAMLPAAKRWQWFLLVPLALVTSAVEAGAAAAIYVLIKIISDPASATAAGWLGTLLAWLPWSGQRALILQLSLLLVLYHVFRSGLIIAAQYLRHKIAYESSAALSCAMLARYLSAPYPFHFRRNSAELIRNCSHSVGITLGGVLTAATSLLSEILIAIGIAATLLAVAPGVAIGAGIVLAVLLALMIRATRRAAARLGGETHELSRRTLQTLQQALGGIKEIKVLGRERYFYDAFGATQQRLLDLGYAGITLGALPSLIIETVFVCGALAVIGVLTLTDPSGAPSLPLVGMFAYAGLRLLPIATRLLARVNEIRGGAQAVADLYADYQALSPNDPSPADNGHDVELRDRITLEQVTYVYPGAAAPAIRDATLTVRRGESIGIVGATGAGKSTLVDLIIGLLPPSAGGITVDGTALTDHSRRWKRQIGYVPQSIFLSDDTLRRNIALGIADAAIDHERILAAVRMAQLEHLVASLPEGLDSCVGERGICLSGGERQRIGIARALYHDPEVMVFDEATSALDSATEAEIAAAIDALRGVKTLLVVAHRLTTVRRCDRLIFLSEGCVAGCGTFEDLRRENPDFGRMAALAVI